MMQKMTIRSIYRLTENDGKHLLKKNFRVEPAICVCDDFAVYLNEDGSVDYMAGIVQPDLSGWQMIRKLAAGRKHIAALTWDGRVLAAGDNSLQQCEVNQWCEVTDISAGAYCTIGITGQKKTLFCGRFVSTDEQMKEVKKDDGSYRIPKEDIRQYGGMVDFTKKILGS